MQFLSAKMIHVNLHSQLGRPPAAMNSCSVLSGGEEPRRWADPSSGSAPINVSFQGSVFLTIGNWDQQGPGTLFMNPGLKGAALTTELTY